MKKKKCTENERKKTNIASYPLVDLWQNKGISYSYHLFNFKTYIITTDLAFKYYSIHIEDEDINLNQPNVLIKVYKNWDFVPKLIFSIYMCTKNIQIYYNKFLFNCLLNSPRALFDE